MSRSRAGGDLRVVMAGPDPAGFGGICSVVGLLLEHAPAVSGVALRHVVTHRDGSVALRLGVFLRGVLAVLALLAVRRVDVLHLHVSERGSLLRKGLLVHLARLWRVPVVLHCHGAELADNVEHLPPAARGLLRGVFARAAAVVVLGPEMVPAVALAGARSEVVRTVPNAVVVPERVPVREQTGRVPVLFLGRMAHRKGASDLVRAVALLDPAVRRRLLLRMFGDGPVAEVQALVDELDLADTVLVHGWLGPQQRDDELARAAVFVLPSYHEGLPMALLEAMAWGVAPVVTPVGSIPTVVTDHYNGLVVGPGDVPALSRALAEVVGSPQLRAQLSTEARRTAQAHDVRGYVGGWASVWADARTTGRRR